jgi:hypothetical protein
MRVESSLSLPLYYDKVGALRSVPYMAYVLPVMFVPSVIALVYVLIIRLSFQRKVPQWSETSKYFYYFLFRLPLIGFYTLLSVDRLASRVRNIISRAVYYVVFGYPYFT